MAASGVIPCTFAINVNGVLVTGIGSSDEEAREDALKQISKMVKQTPAAAQGGYSFNPVITPQFGSSNDVSENVIGKLQEYCQSLRWPLPTYTLEHMQGPSHLPNFSMKCKVLGFTAVGSGNSKKEAKHNAAKMVYQLVMKYVECGHKGKEYKSSLRPICSSENSENISANSVISAPFVGKMPPKSDPVKLDSTISAPVLPEEWNSPKLDNPIVLPHVEQTVNSGRQPLTLTELPSNDKKSDVDSCGSCDGLGIPPDLRILDEEETQKILAEIRPERTEDTSNSEKPIPLPSLEDVLCMRLQNMVTNTDD